MEETMEYFEDIVRNHLAQMRLLVEGGLVMYEDMPEDKDPLLFGLVGEALYSIRTHICDCQQLTAEIQRQMKES